MAEYGVVSSDPYNPSLTSLTLWEENDQFQRPPRAWVSRLREGKREKHLWMQELSHVPLGSIRNPWGLGGLRSHWGSIVDHFQTFFFNPNQCRLLALLVFKFRGGQGGTRHLHSSSTQDTLVPFTLYITVSENVVFEGSSGSLWLPSAMSRVCLKSIFCSRFEFSIKGYRNRYLKIITTEVVICEANTSNGVVCMCVCVCVLWSQAQALR